MLDMAYREHAELEAGELAQRMLVVARRVVRILLPAPLVGEGRLGIDPDLAALDAELGVQRHAELPRPEAEFRRERLGLLEQVDPWDRQAQAPLDPARHPRKGDRVHS